MIEYALLIMLGFCAAGLLALLIAPTIWRRAVRLTTKRLDATLPLSLSEIEAGKDLLRASYAIQIRRLEAGLNKARDKSASQLVEISRLQMVINEFRDRVATLEKQLEERSNAANVFERTIKRRFPELEAALASAKAALDERAYEITSITNEIRRKEEALSLLQRSSGLQQAEIRKLREALEGGSADRTGRFKKRPAQWSLEEFRSEYDRLNLELSKMREQLALAQEREVAQISVLRSELQNLAEQIMTTAATQEKQKAELQRQTEAAPQPAHEPRRSPTRPVPAERPLSAPQPWPRGGETPPARPVDLPTPPAASSGRSPVGTSALPSTPNAAQPTEPSRAPAPERSFVRPSERRPSITSEASPAGAKSETASLKTLLERAASASKGDEAGSPPARQAAETKAPPAAAASREEPAPNESSPASQPTAPAPASASAKGTEPNLDRMLREIFEGRSPATPPAQSEAAPRVSSDKDEEPDAAGKSSVVSLRSRLMNSD